MNKKEKQELDELDEFLELVGKKVKPPTSGETLERLLRSINRALLRNPPKRKRAAKVRYTAKPPKSDNI